MADSASSTKTPKADIREDWDEFANNRNGRVSATDSLVQISSVSSLFRPGTNPLTTLTLNKAVDTISLKEPRPTRPPMSTVKRPVPLAASRR